MSCRISSFALFTLLLFLIFAKLSKATTDSEETFGLFTAWEKFWAISCEFSTVVTRSKRSVQEPNLDDPLELFDYLYPLADVTVDNYINGEQRSARSLFAWAEDLAELWESECHSRRRREKRAAGDGNDNMLYGMEAQADEDSPYTYESPDPDVLRNMTTTTAAPLTPVATKKKEKKAVADTDTFFAQYGGDVEYFFPLISFGVPFDGEITLLGFHGFKGLFPYK